MRQLLMTRRPAAPKSDAGGSDAAGAIHNDTNKRVTALYQGRLMPVREFVTWSRRKPAQRDNEDARDILTQCEQPRRPLEVALPGRSLRQRIDLL